MFYYLFSYLHSLDFTGAGVFEYITFRAAMAVFTSLIISMMFGGRIIKYLRKLQVGETVRDLGLKGQMAKQGTPTMGGLIILSAILIPTLLFAKLHNTYIWLMLISTVWLGAIGFTDDYIKVFKKDKKGLAGKFKVVGQIGIGIIAGSILFFNDQVTIKHKSFDDAGAPVVYQVQDEEGCVSEETQWVESTLTKTTIPFIKGNEFDYRWLLSWAGDKLADWSWLLYIIVVIIIVTAVSNGANMTDGLDGLAGGTSAISGLTLAIFAYLGSNIIFADFLNIMFIPNSEELVIFMGAFVGACIGFLWYNSYPAQVFMGDTGSLAIGGIIAVFALAIKKELLIPIFCGVFLIENLSVVMQVAYFKYTKKKTGVGKRIFLMARVEEYSSWHRCIIITRKKAFTKAKSCRAFGSLESCWRW